MQKRYLNLIFVFFIYLIFYLLFFLRFPLHNSLPGNCDSLLVVAISDFKLEQLTSFFSGNHHGVPMFPVLDPLAYGESSPGGAFFVILFRLLGFNNLVSLYLFLVMLFALNGFAVFIFSKHFLKTFYFRIFAGFAFSLSNMMFAHIDDFIVYFYFFPLVSAFFLIKFLNSNKIKNLFIASFIFAFEIYFSFYVFLYGGFFLILVFLYFSRINGKKINFILKNGVIFSIPILIFALPRIFYYFYTLNQLNFVTPFAPMFTTQMTSLMPFDFVLALPNNLFYGDWIKIPMNWGFVRHHNFIGFLVVGFSVYAFLKKYKYRYFFVSLFLIALILGFGPYFMWNLKPLFPLPLIIFYKFIPILKFLRVTNRVYFLGLLALSVFSAKGGEIFAQKFNKKYLPLIFMLFFVVNFVENVPFPLKEFKIGKYLKTPKVYNFIKEKNKEAKILDLPSRFSTEFLNWDEKKFDSPYKFVKKRKNQPILKVDNLSMFYNSWDNVFQYNRELFYFIWQTNHHLDTFSGVNGYFPVSRMIVQKHIENLPQKKEFLWLKNVGVDFIVFHKNLICNDDKKNWYDVVASTCLKRIFEDNENTVYKINCGK